MHYQQDSKPFFAVSRSFARLALVISGWMVIVASQAAHAVAVEIEAGDLSSSTAASLHLGRNAAAALNEREEDAYRYATSEDLIIRGVVGLVGPSGQASEAPLPEDVVVPAGTEFSIKDRVIDGAGNRLVLVSIDTQDESGSRLNLWVLESELAKSLSPENSIVMNLDEMDAATSKFYFMGGTQVAGPSGLILPVRGARRTSPPGMRVHPILKKRKFHAGWDLAAPIGTPVLAVADAIVTMAGWAGGYGKLIILQHGRLQTRYAHLSRIMVRNGQKVKKGQQIGKVGNTGRSTGPHLHFEKRGPGGRVLTGSITAAH